MYTICIIYKVSFLLVQNKTCNYPQKLTNDNIFKISALKYHKLKCVGKNMTFCRF